MVLPIKGADEKTHYASQSTFKGVTMNTSGIIYLKGQQFNIQNSSNITINPGIIIAGLILPDNSKLSLTSSTSCQTRQCRR
jgi:hypothetical protein